jgi:hypothetical protein
VSSGGRASHAQMVEIAVWCDPTCSAVVFFSINWFMFEVARIVALLPLSHCYRTANVPLTPPYSLFSVSSVSCIDSRVALGPALSVVKGMSNLPIPKENFYAPSRKVVAPNNTSVATAGSIAALLVFDTPRLDTLPAEPPFFVACLAGKCQGGPEFKCNKGYTGTLCSECEREQFYWNGKCDTSCEDISPRGATTVLGIIAVIIVWLILNKSAGGMYVSAHASEKTK